MQVMKTTLLEVGDALYVVLDATRTPGREIAALVLAEERKITQSAALLLVDERRERSQERGVPFIVSAMLARRTLQSFLPQLEPVQRRQLARWLANHVSAPTNMPVVAIAGPKIRAETIPLPSR